MVTFAVFLLLWVITWIGSFSGPTVDKPDAVPVDHRPLRRLRQRRHRHDAPHLLPELHHVRIVPDREVGRQRTVAGLSMIKRIFESRRLARHGAGLRRGRRSRFAAPAMRAVRHLRSRRPAWSACWLYIARPVARNRRSCSAARRRATARSPASSVLVVLGILVAVNYIGARQNKRWDLTANKQFSLSDQSRNVLHEARRAAADHGVRAGAGVPALPGQAEGIRVRLEAGHDRVHRSRQEAGRSRSRTGFSSTARSSSTTRAAPSA